MTTGQSLASEDRGKPPYTVEAGGVGVCVGAVGFHTSPMIEPTTPRTKPIKPTRVYSAPIIVKTRTRIAPVLILNLFSLFIITDPTIMTTPQTRPSARIEAVANAPEVQD